MWDSTIQLYRVSSVSEWSLYRSLFIVPIFLEIVEVIFEIWSFQFSFLSTMTPRNFTVSSRVTKHPSISPSLYLFYKGFNFTSVTNYNQHQTRYSMHKLYIPYFRTVCRKNSINCAGPLIRKSLQSHIVTSSCIYNFKKLLILSLLECYTL